jgi:hypothetical protein
MTSSRESRHEEATKQDDKQQPDIEDLKFLVEKILFDNGLPFNHMDAGRYLVAPIGPCRFGQLGLHELCLVKLSA